MEPFLIFIICIVGCISCSGSLALWFRKYFVKNRKSIVRVGVYLKYLPPKKEEILEEVVHFRRLTKRERRRIRIMVMRKSFKANEEGQHQCEEGEDEDLGFTEGPSTFENIMNFVSSKFSKKSIDKKKMMIDIETGFGGNGEAEEEKYDIDNHASSLDTPVVESNKSTRFISQDRLDRAASRKKVIEAARPTVIVEEIPETVEEKDPITAIIDLGSDLENRAQTAVERRRLRREVLKNAAAAAGEEDMVQINSGPDQSLLPHGWLPIAVVPALCDQELVGKKVMYLLEKTTEQRVGGWYPGRIAGPSKKEGCNYNVKFDRLETGTLFVDGIRNVELDLIGDNAYGRRWIVLVPNPEAGKGPTLVIKKKSKF